MAARQRQCLPGTFRFEQGRGRMAQELTLEAQEKRRDVYHKTVVTPE